MIHFHGGPITPVDAAVALWTRRHAMVSFECTTQAALAFEICQTVRLDCGAFSKWRGDGSQVDIPAYADWVRQWEHHPAFDEAIIPDAIEGDYSAAPDIEASWFIDAPYRGRPGAGYVHHSGRIDYPALGAWCLARRGQTIVCESAGADWLPFAPFGSVRGMGGAPSREAIWWQDSARSQERLALEVA